MITSDTQEIPVLAWNGNARGAVVDAARGILATVGLVRLTGFPASAAQFVQFLRAFGQPLGYYGDDAGTHPEDRAIWRIKYDPAAAFRGETHAVEGPLHAHSSQSMRDPRPRFFSMLMVDGGWQGRPFGMNGESILASWRDALERMRHTLGTEYAATMETLRAPVLFPDGVRRPLVYPLASSKSEDDLGVRMKSDLMLFLTGHCPEEPAAQAVARLADAAAHTALRVQLQSGDLVLLDNDRWGHGRESVVGREAHADGSVHLNPRELWSATVA
ncbi:MULTISPECIES: TauD/TfdA family dioxygenase [unclassified Nocardioides]|uniref:TauD/TfdA family dioxygenase n=1 Tax=unclassified Nocardioides TaxID=2615069 RepID=UPI0000570C25|nr:MULTISPECIES: TauD/TfdA family dioxygenase [unclassified Nocardioides]ABL80562.1 hypothetical protein Noca_1043 [Nocardioides sp. JS614]